MDLRSFRYVIVSQYKWNCVLAATGFMRANDEGKDEE